MPDTPTPPEAPDSSGAPTENPMAGLAESWRSSSEDRSQLERLVEVATTLETATRVSEIADRAGCSPNFAREKLELLATLGVLERASTDPVTYRRDETHFRRLRAKALLEDHDGTIDDLIKQYRERDRELKEHFGVESPTAVSYEYFEAFDDPDAIADESDALSAWDAVRERLADLERAKAIGAAKNSPQPSRPSGQPTSEDTSEDDRILNDLY